MFTREAATERLIEAKRERGVAYDAIAEAVAKSLQRPPKKGEDDPTLPSDPMLYRLYEIPQVYGEAIKAVVHEEFGDGIMSAIDFECHVDRVEADDGDRVRITYEEGVIELFPRC